MRRLLSFTGSAAALLGLALAGSPAQAQVILDFTGNNAFGFSAVAGTAGWEFTVDSGSLTVNSIGFWDQGANGLVNSHQVGLWDINQNLLRSATVTSAATPIASTEDSGRWLFASILEITLAPGTYVLAAEYDGRGGADPDFIHTNANATTISNVTFVNSRQFTGGVGLTFPNEVIGSVNDGVFGPNLAFIGNGATAPEPGTLALLGAGLGMVGLLARRKR